MGRLHTCYSPVRRSPAKKASLLTAAPRLACVKPVASVHPEPGSNSSLFILFLSFSILKGRQDSVVNVCLKQPSASDNGRFSPRCRMNRFIVSWPKLTESKIILLLLYYFVSIVILSMFVALRAKSVAKLRRFFELCKFCSRL